MDAETRARALEPFFTTKARGHGTGLGLATVYGTIEQSGGYISLYSDVGQGTIFKIYLPTSAERAASAGGAETVRAQRGETILVAEDEPQLRGLVTAFLRSLGYEVLVAADGPAAVEIATTHQGRIDLLLTDVVMPEMSGKAVAEAVCELRPRVPVVYMSGYPYDVLGRQNLDTANVALIQKPFSRETLGRTIRSALDGARAVRAS
jgi:CheY-like chemotaxis protein